MNSFANILDRRFLWRLTNPNLWIMVIADILSIFLAHYLAHCLRFEFVFDFSQVERCIGIMWWLIPMKLGAFAVCDLYRGMWRYTGIQDMVNLVKANVLASGAVVVFVLVVYRFEGFSRGVFAIDFMMTFLLTAGYRMSIRMYFDRQNGNGGARLPFVVKTAPPSAKRVLIIGAGDAGEKTLREIVTNRDLSYDVVGFVDDDPRKVGMLIHRVPVLCDTARMGEFVTRYGIEEVLIAIPTASGKQMRRIVETCKDCRLSFKTLPSLGELIDGKVSLKALRDVSFEDLLGRPPVELDTDVIREYLAGKRVLVTGAGGSIGSELCRQIIRFAPERLILVDSSEPSLHGIRSDLKHHHRFDSFVCVLGMVQDRHLMNHVFERHKPQVVFHAAAYKHVPIMEENPWQAVRNNVRGSRIVMEKCIKHQVERFILVSTDKAVRPTNVMGASKRVCELMMLGLSGNGTRMMGVRFGNVVGSSGSVIPLFRRQIERGGPVTVTHPEVTRYFMTIPEAAQLILQAGAQGDGGEIFVLEMGTPVKIADMARDLIKLSGKVPDEDIEIQFTGLRPGEKLYEELITHDEGVVRTAHDKIMVIKSNGHFDGRVSHDAYAKWIFGQVDALSYISDDKDACAIKAKLKEIVPEFTPDEGDVCVV